MLIGDFELEIFFNFQSPNNTNEISLSLLTNNKKIFLKIIALKKGFFFRGNFQIASKKLIYRLTLL
jgi:hypothetical protein